ncbi:flagellar biosynthesis protein FlhF [Colwellia hornerae]|uniref:Flagellar biosynthesis protein FlhF n=1 Tax=Colwellia hornerae TaxID=89402 RepID=A0A5C6QKP7_9GAMM|nr:flagellar biosynthesis protein FlhF [Colwellia hornerae]TWX54173.1 flagellar biosynthesis protein FlhF [Colwellia hornerae]TWX60948.1 flagellar biosynthesis protein FlhF [Colwellia hornerae]TWX69247.1 flagellar biosynthesis protein FlhF [Colwellia hornerae]
MKIKRFVAKDMRSALTQIKDELGADAVIMSNKRVPEGVELMAAVDNNVEIKATQPSAPKFPENTSAPQATDSFDRSIDNDVVNIRQNNPLSNAAVAHNSVAEDAAIPSDSLAALLSRQVQQAPANIGQGINQVQHDKIVQAAAKLTQNNPSSSAQVSTPTPSNNIEQQFKSFTDRLEQNSQEQGNEQPSDSYQQPAMNQAQSLVSATNGLPAQDVNNADLEKMKHEMSSIRELLEHQISGLMWQDMAQKDPARAMLVNRLMSLGMSEQVSDQIAGYIPAQKNDQDTWQLAKKFISQQINTTNNDIIHRGGVVSLVGPTGVGKTTTVAKLAARFAQIHGADQVVMISTDNYRIAGFEQLATYGRIIGCDVKLASDAKTLDTLLQQFSKKKLILIDTAGMGQRDMRLAKHLTTLVSNARVRIRNYLVLAANTQQRVMQENVDRFKKVPLAGCIYTKLDESLSIGEIISTSIQNGLAIGYLTDGQRVPEDIKVANAEKLVTLADKMSAKNQINNPINWRTAPMSANTAVFP